MGDAYHETLDRLLSTATDDQLIDALVNSCSDLGFRRARFWDVARSPLDKKRFYLLRQWSADCVGVHRGKRVYAAPVTDEHLRPGAAAWFSSRDPQLRERQDEYPWMQEFELDGDGWLEVPLVAGETILGLWTLVREATRAPQDKELSDLCAIAAVAALKLYETRQIRITQLTQDLFADVDWQNPVAYCLRNISIGLSASFVALFVIDPIRDRVDKRLELYYDGQQCREFRTPNSDNSYRVGEYLTGAAARDPDLSSVPDFARFTRLRPELVNMDCVGVHTAALSGRPLTTLLYRKTDIPGSTPALIRVMNRADDPDLSFSATHEGTLDRMLNPCAHILAVHFATERIASIWNTFSSAVAQLKGHALQYKSITDGLSKQGFPAFVLTVWTKAGRLSDVWTADPMLLRALQSIVAQVSYPEAWDIGVPTIASCDLLPTPLKGALEAHGIGLLYVVPTDEPVGERYEQERTLAFVPLHIAEDSVVSSGVEEARGYWKRKRDLLQYLSVEGWLAGAVRSLSRNQHLLYLAEQAVGTIGHEIKSPAASLQNLAQVEAYHFKQVLRQLELGQPVQQDVEEVSPTGQSRRRCGLGVPELRAWLVKQDAKIAQYARFLERVVNDAVRWARMGGRAVEADLREVLLYPILRDCLQSLKKELAEQHRLRIIIQDNISGLPPFVADPFYMRILFTNLLDNAIKYSWARGVGYEHVVRVFASRQTRLLEVEIVNWGLGIAESDYNNIFSSFYRSTIRDRKHTVRGVGLGLATCMRIARIHGGTILVKSTPTLDDPQRTRMMEGYETRFTVRLPTDLKLGRVDVDTTTWA